VPRRVRMPAADDLFRPTAVPDADDTADVSGADAAPQVVELPSKKSAAGKQPAGQAPVGRTASGRVKHDEKMTVYVTADELLDLEDARIALRRHHGLAVDRGRLVRAAVALALADLDEHGADSALVRRLSEA
jgi:hypothetical protein